MRAFMVLPLLLWAAGPASAQDAAIAVEQPRCWLGSMSYSPGATATAGNAVMTCGPDFTWNATAEWASGCLHGGDFYSVGAIQNASGQQQILTRCQSDGTWEVVTAENRD